MIKFSIINLEWNIYNGFFLELLRIENNRSIEIDGALFAINVHRKFFYVSILWHTIKVFDNSIAYRLQNKKQLTPPTTK